MVINQLCLRQLQQTPGTYPRTSNTCLWLRIPEVYYLIWDTWRGLLDFVCSDIYLEDHPSWCKWLGSPPFFMPWSSAIWKGSQNPKRRFGSDDFPFQKGDVTRFQPLVFGGVSIGLSPQLPIYKALSLWSWVVFRYVSLHKSWDDLLQVAPSPINSINSSFPIEVETKG